MYTRRTTSRPTLRMKLWSLVSWFEPEMVPYSLFDRTEEPYAVHIMGCSPGTDEFMLSTCTQHVYVVKVVGTLLLGIINRRRLMSGVGSGHYCIQTM